MTGLEDLWQVHQELGTGAGVLDGPVAGVGDAAAFLQRVGGRVQRCGGWHAGVAGGYPPAGGAGSLEGIDIQPVPWPVHCIAGPLNIPLTQLWAACKCSAAA